MKSKFNIVFLSLLFLSTAIYSQDQDSIPNYKQHIFLSLEEAAKAHPDSVYKIHLYGDVKYTSFPKEIYRYKNLRELMIKSSPITIPSDICKLENLESLSICWNEELKKIPKAITCLKKLKYLDFTGTPISTLPKNIGELQNLQHLNLSFCHIKKFPDSFFNLKNLKDVTIGVEEWKPLFTEQEKQELKRKMPNTRFNW